MGPAGPAGPVFAFFFFLLAVADSWLWRNPTSASAAVLRPARERTARRRSAAGETCAVLGSTRDSSTDVLSFWVEFVGPSHASFCRCCGQCAMRLKSLRKNRTRTEQIRHNRGSPRLRRPRAASKHLERLLEQTTPRRNVWSRPWHISWAGGHGGRSSHPSLLIGGRR